MKFISSIFGLMAVFCIFGDANADLRVGGDRAATNATGRVSLAVNPTTAAARRLPTMISAKNVTTTATTTSTSSLMDVTECVDSYTECIKDADACGTDFEECTTNELFYAKKPQCNSVLLQCSTAGINALFGTTSTTNLATKNSNDEYVYPTAGSILGQFIEAGAINNRLDKSSCVKRYTSCLKKESVCGEDFELCTSNSEFKKQKIFCESTLARCTDDGKTELFGSTKTDSNPTAASRLGIMIKEGADLASVNAVSTCYKVADQCILSACNTNPYKCIVDSTFAIVNATDDVNENAKTTSGDATSNTDVITTSLISRYIKSACAETIGGNKYCYMTANEGKVPTASQITDPENREDVYADIYAARMNTILRDKIKKIADDFDKKAKDKCSDTITACAMRSCGSGLGSACYSKVFATGTSSADFKNSINGDATYVEIQRGCESIVNTDANCKYSAASVDNKTYSYEYSDAGAFDMLFPAAATGKDPIGVVARLNASLAENYNDAAIEKMAKQCKNTAVSCIRSLCGADFKNCYRNRTDVMTDTYATDEEKFNQSMNKVGGVLDFTIVRGLCLETVKNADVCDEHLKIQVVKNYTDGNGNTGWGDNKTVRDAWVGAVSSGYSAKLVDIEGEVVETGLCTIDQSRATNAKCKEKITDAWQCGYIDEDGCLYDVDQLVPRRDYQLSMAADTLFQEVMGDLEKEAQAKYNAKLTAEQHMCVDANNGGIMGRNDHSSTYMWVKLKNRKVPKNYSTNGLAANDFVASNDLYGSFCRARVTIQSDDPDIQTVLQKGQKWSTAYFAVGDVFTCGSWIPQKDLEEIAKKVSGQVKGTEAYERAQQQAVKDNRNANLIAALSAVGVATGTGFLVNKLQDQNILGGLLNKNVNTQTQSTRNRYYAESCRTSFADLKAKVGQVSAADSNEAKKAAAAAAAAALKSHAESIKDRGGTTSAISAEALSTDCAASALDGGGGNTKCLTTAESIANECQVVIDSKGEYDVDAKQDNTRRWVSIGTAGVAGIGTFFVVRKLAKDIKNENLTAEQQAAYDEFMRNVGDHIYCFIGADEAGTYGDLIEISID